MKQIVPFKKELAFKTRVNEITSISLEREIEIEKEGIVTGVFHITGDYKMNEASINRDDFSFDLPFDITLDPRYDISSVKADIEDFYYDVVNNDTLKVNIDLFIEAEYLPEEEITLDDDSSREATNVDDLEVVFDTDEDLTQESNDVDIDVDTIISDNTKSEDNMDIKSDSRDDEVITASDLFSNLDNTETYSTYYIYIVKEEDTIDKILVKYGISKEELESYNDITNIKPGDKVVIPKSSE